MNHSPYRREPPYAKHLSRLIRPFPNFDFFFIKRVREKAVQALQLRPGGHVLDLGCGGGGSFPYLVKAVGSTGKVVGVDISPQSCINARHRVERNGWKNVEVIEAAAESVDLPGRYDGALMFAAADVYASESALAHIEPCLKDRARVAIFGAKLSQGLAGKLLNPFFLLMCRKLSPATPTPDPAPWALLAGRVDDLNVEELFFGSMFLASGTLKARQSGA
ncbi:SAM-dependent methyltransferase [Lysobacter koreensis]|uniref:SAM-dependent methyltransferase n=1 Tax=Lysobacter koreensis TaxID=266122 RepID=A0ABW2YH77_9GAMM